MTATDPTDTVRRLTDEGLIGTAEVARRMPRSRGGDCHPSTVTRWCLRGVRLADGRRVRLEHVRIGSRLVTSWEAVLRFIGQQQTPTAHDEHAEHRTPAARNRAAEAAARELEELGA